MVNGFNKTEKIEKEENYKDGNLTTLMVWTFIGKT